MSLQTGCTLIYGKGKAHCTIQTSHEATQTHNFELVRWFPIFFSFCDENAVNHIWKDMSKYKCFLLFSCFVSLRYQLHVNQDGTTSL